MAILIAIVSACYISYEKFNSYVYSQRCGSSRQTNKQLCTNIDRDGIKFQYYWINFLVYAIPTSIGVGLAGSVQGWLVKKK